MHDTQNASRIYAGNKLNFLRVPLQIAVAVHGVKVMGVWQKIK